jgi:MoaA/NifB/PqqE/SkfB family radical SAM enzyme
MYDMVYFEISGLCNARCPWCVRGNGHLKSYPARFIPPQEFQKGIERLFDEGLIGPDSIVGLYNYGEPLLHPSLKDILKILSDNKLKFIFSTNASVFVDLDENLFKNLQNFFISIPGFSQKSYDKIHGFTFEEILKNIDKWIDLIGPDRIQIQYHVYKFNLDEINAAATYFKQKGLRFFPYCALMADYELALSYLNNTLPKDLSEKASRELLLSYVKDYITLLPKKYTCLQESILTIDEYCNVLTCCLISKADPDYSIGSLFSLSREEIESKKICQNICRECRENGIAYWVHNVYRPEFIQKYDQ